MGCQQWGQPGKDLKASHGKMGVSRSISGSPELGRCHLSAGCKDRDVSAPGRARGVRVPPHLGECSPVEPPGARSLEAVRAAALSPSSLTPKKHYGVPGSVAALELGAVGVLGAAR